MLDLIGLLQILLFAHSLSHTSCAWVSQILCKREILYAHKEI